MDLRRGLPLAGWDRYSVWGFDTGVNSFFAQLWKNDDDSRGEPQAWITPGGRYAPRPLVSVYELAAAIAAATGCPETDVSDAMVASVPDIVARG
jgi:hypothetical protein